MIFIQYLFTCRVRLKLMKINCLFRFSIQNVRHPRFQDLQKDIDVRRARDPQVDFEAGKPVQAVQPDMADRPDRVVREAYNGLHSCNDLHLYQMCF